MIRGLRFLTLQASSDAHVYSQEDNLSSTTVSLLPLLDRLRAPACGQSISRVTRGLSLGKTSSSVSLHICIVTWGRWCYIIWHPISALPITMNWCETSFTWIVLATETTWLVNIQVLNCIKDQRWFCMLDQILPWQAVSSREAYEWEVVVEERSDEMRKNKFRWYNINEDDIR